MSLTVAFRDVARDFGAVRVLSDVSLDLAPGRVYGLLGENGAGKSTLMKILAGYLQPSAGEVRIDDRPVHWADARAAEDAGIVLIHQELNLAEDLTLAQNIFLGHEIRHGWFVDDRAMNSRAAEALMEVGYHGRPDARVRSLIPAHKQLVEIAKARVRNIRLLILDEPTASLTPAEADHLFGLIGRLKAEGVTVIYISHKLDEVERITDEIIVMRDGRFVARAPTAATSRAKMAALMIGRDLADLYPPRHVPERRGPPVLTVSGLSVPGVAAGVSFSVQPGEILGFAGLVGAGRTEVFEGLIGLRPVSEGTVTLKGETIRFASPLEAARHGLTYLSEDRKGKALHVDMSLRSNLTLTHLAPHARPFLSAASEERSLEAAVTRFGIRKASSLAPAASLSGGNQQKLAIAKFLEPGPDIVVLDEPTRGVDVGAKAEIYSLIARLAAEGKAVIVISSELLELIGICHRVIVMRHGTVAAEVAGDEITEEILLGHAIGTRAAH